MNLAIYDPVDIRWIIERDIEEIIKIEQKCFQYPWNKADFHELLTKKNCVGLAAVCDRKIVGYIVYELGEKYYEVLNLAILPEFRRRRIATSLINRILRKLSPTNRIEAAVCIREKNLAAQLFFKKQEFVCTQILHDFFEVSDTESENAYLMEYILNVEEV